MNLFPSLSQKAVQTGLIAAVLAFLVHGFDEGCSYVGLASFVSRLRAGTTSYDRQEQIRPARTTDTPTTIIRRATTRQDELHQTQSRAATNTKHSPEQQTENCRHHLQHCCIVDYFSEAMLLSRNVDTCETSNYVTMFTTKLEATTTEAILAKMMLRMVITWRKMGMAMMSLVQTDMVTISIVDRIKTRMMMEIVPVGYGYDADAHVAVHGVTVLVMIVLMLRAMMAMTMAMIMKMKMKIMWALILILCMLTKTLMMVLLLA